jgi:hypothetical protein
MWALADAALKRSLAACQHARLLPKLAHGTRDRSNSSVRERSLALVMYVMDAWARAALAKQPAALAAAVSVGIGDPRDEIRALGRAAFWLLSQQFPHLAQAFLPLRRSPFRAVPPTRRGIPFPLCATRTLPSGSSAAELARPLCAANGNGPAR